MLNLYLPYTSKFDNETGTHCLTGKDAQGLAFGVGAGRTLEESCSALRAWILEVLVSHADAGEDHFDDLRMEPPRRGAYLIFDSMDLVPIRLRLQRAHKRLLQEDMACRMGTSRQNYAKLERPGTNLTLKTITQLERVLGVELLALPTLVPRKAQARRVKT